MNYWLVKSEPDVFSIHDLQRVDVEGWNGVRNYQARNMLRDQMRIGDQILFYHSSCTEPGIVGLAEVASSSYPDMTALEPDSPYYDAKSTLENPRWYQVDVKFIRRFARTITLNQLRNQPALTELLLLRKGNRLSVMPVSPTHWHSILALENS